jgi:hypothetical protein
MQLLLWVAFVRGVVTMVEITSAEMTDDEDPSLEIRVLGDLAVLRNGENVCLPPSRKTRALLAYLAVTNHGSARPIYATRDFPGLCDLHRLHGQASAAQVPTPSGERVIGRNEVDNHRAMQRFPVLAPPSRRPNRFIPPCDPAVVSKRDYGRLFRLIHLDRDGCADPHPLGRETSV